MKPSTLTTHLKNLLSQIFPQSHNLLNLLQPPPHIKYDISTNIAMLLAKELHKNPSEIAKTIIDLLNKNGFDAEFNSGFINISLPPEIYSSYIKTILINQKPFTDEKNLGKKVIIEFVSANPTGPLHLASARGACLGDSLANILTELGYEVFKEYYVNDCGRQVELLGKSLYARYEGKEPPEDGYQGEYLIELAKKLPLQATSWSLEDFTRYAVDWMVKMHKEDLEMLGVRFDRWFFESELHSHKLPQMILSILQSKGVVEKKDNALWLKTADEKDEERVLQRSDGTNTYFLNDLAYHWTKYERGFDQIIDIWGADHHGYIPRMKAGIRLLGLDETRFKVIIHQLVSIKKGDEILKMSKRAGRFHTLRELIEETSKDAVRFFFTMRHPNTHIIFDTELAKKQSNENPLYYVQYAHARISSIIKNSYSKNIPQDKDNFDGYQLTDDDRAILKKIFWFEKVLIQSQAELTPHHITTYLIDLAKEFHSYYERNRVIDEANPKISASRIFLLKGVKEILKKGLGIIGVKAPDEM